MSDHSHMPTRRYLPSVLLAIVVGLAFSLFYVYG